MSVVEAITSVFQNYAVFRGRARRKEYTLFQLFKLLLVVLFVLALVITGVNKIDEMDFFWDIGSAIESLLSQAAFISIMWMLTMLAVLVPSLALTSRRLHDIGKSGAYMFLGLLPFAAPVMTLILAFHDGQPWENQYGTDPKRRNRIPFTSEYAAGVAGAPYTAFKREKSASEGKRCKFCGKMVDADSVFCPTCGRDLRPAIHTETRPTGYAETRAKSDTIKRDRYEKITCATCGKNVDKWIEVCPYCGCNPRKHRETTTPTRSSDLTPPSGLG